MTDGGLTIVNQQVQGTNSAGYSGDIRTAETYSTDQSSQVQVTSTQLTGGQWVGPAVRAQAGGADLYLGIYFWNGGSPELMLFLRNNGNWSQLAADADRPAGPGHHLEPQRDGTGPHFRCERHHRHHRHRHHPDRRGPRSHGLRPAHGGRLVGHRRDWHHQDHHGSAEHSPRPPPSRPRPPPSRPRPPSSRQRPAPSRPPVWPVSRPSTRAAQTGSKRTTSCHPTTAMAPRPCGSSSQRTRLREWLTTSSLSCL